MKTYPVSLSLGEANLIRKALGEYVDPDEWEQEMIANICRKVLFVK